MLLIQQYAGTLSRLELVSVLVVTVLAIVVMWPKGKAKREKERR